MTTVVDEESNRYADFWRYEIGVNVIPAASVNKNPIVEWKKYQDSPVSEEQHNEWKERNMFANGVAVVLGKVWHKPDKLDYYLVGIDLDNQKAINEICTRNGKTLTLEQWASTTLVEQHKNNKNKAHIYFYSSRPLIGKSSDKNIMGDKIDRNEIPAFEIKSLGRHGIFMCANSMHATGSRYEIIGDNKTPAVLDGRLAGELEHHIDSICQKYGIDYLNLGRVRGGQSRIPIEEFFKEGVTIEEGHNRHEALLRVMESLIARNRTILPLDEIKEIAIKWNNKVCRPPLDDTELDNQWNDAVGFISRKLVEKQEDEEEKKEAIRDIGIQVEEKKASLDFISVSEAARLHEGVVKVKGIIAAMYKLEKLLKGAQLECGLCHTKTDISYTNQYGKPLLYSDKKGLAGMAKCSVEGCEGHAWVKRYYYANGIFIELRDSDNLSDIDPLKAILLDDDTVDAYMHLGETVTITGLLDVMARRSAASTHMYIDAIEYETTTELIISLEDVRGIKRLVKLKGEGVLDFMAEKMFAPDIIDYNYVKKGIGVLDFMAEKMFAPDIIDYNYVKKGILLIAASTNTDIDDKKLNALLIGDPGLAKSEFLRRAVELVINSRYESAQNSSGKSLTAIVEKIEEGSAILRMGAVPAAKGAICALNEVGRMDPDQQKHLLDVAQEQVFTINKHGINSKIRSPTALIGSANPVAGEWKDSDRIDLDEIPAIKPLLDRLDYLFVFRKTRDEDAIRKYIEAKSRLDNIKIPNYITYLRKHIEYCKRFNPKCSTQADYMLTEYVIRVLRNYGSPRIRESVYKTAKMIARLKLKSVVDASDAKETMEFYNFILQQFTQVVNVTSDPRDIAVGECVKVINESQFALQFTEIIKAACQRNEQVRRYIGDKYDLRNNHKLRPIADMLTNSSNSVRQISIKPLVFAKPLSSSDDKDESPTRTIDPLCDACDACDGDGQTDKSEKSESGSPKPQDQAENPTNPDDGDRSHTSHRSHSRNNVIVYSCKYCGYEVGDAAAIRKHCVTIHQRKNSNPDRNGRNILDEEQR
jgi:DNA replicative helicase MCM subunit Mcm2 (Cdc46/Mcm family)